MAASENGHGIGNAFASSGRIGPFRALAITVIAAVILKLVGEALDRGGMIAYVIAGAVAGATLAKLLAEWSRRLHDTNVSAKWGLLAGVVAAIGLVFLTTSALRDDMPWLLTAAWIVIGVILAVALLRPGTRGDNRFGPPPASPFAVAGIVTPAVGRRAMIWAVVATLGGALIGYTLIDISDGMRAAQERTRLYVEQEGGR